MSCVSVLTQHSLLLDSSYFYKVLNIEQNLHFWVCSVSWSQLYPLSHHCVGYTVLYEIVPHRCTVHIQGIMTVAEAAGGNLTRKLYFHSLYLPNYQNEGIWRAVISVGASSVPGTMPSAVCMSSHLNLQQPYRSWYYYLYLGKTKAKRV